MSEQNGWERDFVGIDFKDERLNKRFFSLMDAINETPEESVPAASGGRAAAKGAYRLLGSEAATHDGIELAIRNATIEKMRQSSSQEILLVQDTCSVSHGNRKGIAGMGHYCDSGRKGMMVHSCVAVTGEGLPLGVVRQSATTRPERKVNRKKKDELRKRPIEEKESFRWISTLRAAHERIPEGIRTVTVCDREGDFHELFADAGAHGEQFPVRLVRNRPTTDGGRILKVG